MKHGWTVLKSINLPGEMVCLDLFQRRDMTFGFETYRRDPEDGRGWYPTGHHARRVFEDERAAWEAALVDVRWLSEAAAAQ